MISWKYPLCSIFFLFIFAANAHAMGGNPKYYVTLTMKKDLVIHPTVKDEQPTLLHRDGTTEQKRIPGDWSAKSGECFFYPNWSEQFDFTIPAHTPIEFTYTGPKPQYLYTVDDSNSPYNGVTIYCGDAPVANTADLNRSYSGILTFED